MKSWIYLFVLAPIWLGICVGIAVWMTKHGAPQQVWLFCDTLHWCQ